MAFLYLFYHLDSQITSWSQTLGSGLYVLLFLVVFCETGLVVMPFLPGDSLLFAAGALCARDGSPLSIGLLTVVLWLAAVVGDAVNYAVGRRLGPKVFSRPKSWLFNTTHLQQAQAFYERHGGQTIAIARFVPLVRTFAPFVAGVGQMRYRRFFVFNVVGAAMWVLSLTWLGYGFGNLPVVQHNFQFVVLGIVLISMLPIAIELWRERQRLGNSSLPG